jgi:acyl-CoA synthetase (AMP-forming)/AMP-acid ligase II
LSSLADLLFAPSAGATPNAERVAADRVSRSATSDAIEDDVLVFAGATRTTRRELVDEASAVRDALVELGIEPGMRVAVMLGNDAGTIATLFGVWAARAVYVPVNPRLADREIEQLVTAVAPAALISGPDDDARLAVVEPPALEDAMKDDTDVALIQTTSGTTGRPRPVPLHHSTVLTLLDGVIGTVRGRADDLGDRRPMPNLIPVSLSLWAGIYNVCFAFRVGAPVVLMDRFDPRELARLVAEFGIRSVVLPPAAMAMCCDDDTISSLAPLRYVRSITAPLSPFLARRFHDRFGVAVLNCYGQTELGGEVVGWSAADWREFGATKLGAVGRPHAGVEVRVDEQDELWVRTPVSTGSAATLGERVDAEGWVRTGDCGRVDDEGFVWIEGRVSDMVNRGGLKVYPAEVEEVLRAAPGVEDVAVLGVADVRLGEVPVAFVVGRFDPAALEAYAREHLAPYKVPVRFEGIDRLPRNEIGKVLARELAARAQGSPSS